MSSVPLKILKDFQLALPPACGQHRKLREAVHIALRFD